MGTSSAAAPRLIDSPSGDIGALAERTADRYRALVEAVGEIVWTNSPEGEMRGAQPGWCSYTGQSEEEVQGYGWSTAVHPDDAQPTIEAWTHAVATRSMFIFEHRVRKRDGSYRWFAIRAVPVLEPDGALREWVGLHRDVDNEKKLEAARELATRAVHAQRRIVETLFNSAPAPIALIRGPELVLEFVNPQCATMWRRDGVAELVGKPLVEGLPELDGQGFDDRLRQVMATGEPFYGNEVPISIRGNAGDLTQRFFNFVYSPVPNEHGVLDGVGVFAFDVTMQVEARARAETLADELLLVAADRARLLEQEQRARAAAEEAGTRLHSLFMHAPAPICILEGPEHRYTLANLPYSDLVGRHDLVGKTIAEAFPEAIERGIVAQLDRVWSTGERLHGKERRLDFTGFRPGATSEVIVNFVYQPFRDHEGRVVGILVVAFDVTDVVEARLASEQARLAAEASEDAQRRLLDFQERFVAVLGHDLRNPLSAIDMGAAVLRMRAGGEVDPQAVRVLDRISSSSRRMSRMIEQILDLTRSRIGGGLPLNPAAMDLSIVLTEIVDELRTAHPARTIELRCASLVGSWDHDRLEQVFSNLISNAIQHGIADKPVTIDARLDDAGQVVVDVHNDGAPIPEELRRQLFDPFRRGSRDSRSTNTAGLGLGLYISRSIVAAHGGELEAHSSSGEGTTFRVTLPLRTSNVPSV